jgi:hypothetical protein
LWKALCPRKSQKGHDAIGGKKPERSGRKSNLPVELLLHADCLDVKEFILLKDEPTEDT